MERVEIPARLVSLDSAEEGNSVALQGSRPLSDVVEGPYFIRADKLLRETGLAESGSEGARKVKQNAVRINGQTISSLVFHLNLPAEITVRVGKRIKNVALLK